MKAFLLLLTGIFWCFVGNGQDFSNKGKDFWVGYGYHQQMVGLNGQQMVLYFTSDVRANITVDIPGLNWTRNYTVNANAVVESAPMPQNSVQDARLRSEQVYSTGIHITSDKPIVAYAHIFDQSVSGATLLFPTNTLGQDYYSLNFRQVSNIASANSWAYVVATEDNTAVEITPKAQTLTHAANIPFVVQLNKGQIYNLMGTTNGNNGVDLTGTRIRSISTGTTSCKRIAVFSGSGRLAISCNGSAPSSDNLIQQVFPKSAWGKRFLTTPTSTLTNNFFRVAVSDPATVVTVDGVPLTNLVGGFYYEFQTTTPKQIVSDQPVMVAQYISSSGASGCNNNSVTDGDPEMIYISPVEQTISNITLNSTNKFAITKHYINVVIKSSGVNSFRLDNLAQAANFLPHPSDPNYSFATFQVASGAHNLRSDSGFNAIAYGYGNAESYGYNAGTNIKDLYQFVSLQNQYATVNFPAICKSTPFKFSITLPYQPLSLVWDFGNNANLSPNTTYTDNSPTADSVYVRDGKTLLRFSVPGNYNFTSAGTYPVKVIVNNPNSDGCPGVQEISYDVEVFEKPTTDFFFNHSGCLTDSVFFFETVAPNARPTTKWSWDFGDATNDTVKNPHKGYNTPGVYTVKLNTVNDIGCISDTSKPITISNPPVAFFTATDTVCAGSPVVFTDASTISAGNIVTWTWNFGNGTVITNTTGAPVTQTFTTPGTFTVTLAVAGNTGCKSVVFSKTITVRPRPTVDFTMPGVCIPSGVAQFTNLSTISDGSGGTLSYLWSFGDGTTDTARNPVHQYTTAGPFNVTLKVTSVYGCFKDSTKTFSNIFAQPKAAFTAPAQVCLSDSAQFMDASTTSNGTVTQWSWNFGDGSTSTLKNPKKKYAVPGTYQVTLVITSSNGCISDTATSTITVGLAPSAGFNSSLPACVGQPVVFTDASTTPTGSLVRWNWNFGDGSTLIGTSNTSSHAYLASGNYLVSLVVENNGGCRSDTIKKTVNIGVAPRSDFSFPAAVCLPNAVVPFTNTSSISDGTQATLTYSWDFGDGTTSSLKDPVHTYAGAGPFTVKLVVTSANGCVKDTSKLLNTLLARPKSDFTVSPEVCLGDTTIFTDQSTAQGNSVVRWRWDFGDGTTDTIKNPKHRYLTAGTFTVKLFVLSAAGCVGDTITKTTLVNPLPTASFITSTPGCVGQAITITDQSSANAGTVTQWQWDFGDGTTVPGAGGAPFSKTYAAAGTYQIRLIIRTDKGCRSDTARRTVVIGALPVVNFGLPNICAGDATAVFTDSSSIADGTQSAFTYLWNFGDANSTGANPNTATTKNPTHIYSAAGTYTVSLSITSVNGCVATRTKQLVVSGGSPVADFTLLNSLPICGNELIRIQNLSSVAPGNISKIEVTWDVAGAPGTTDSDNNPALNKVYSHQYPASATTVTYQVRMRAYSGVACVGEKITAVTINAKPRVSFAAIPGICLGATARQITQATAPGFQGNGTYSGTGVNASGLFDPTISGAGTFTIRYVFVSTAGCADTANQTITVWLAPVARPVIVLPTCIGSPVTFTDSSTTTIGRIVQWKWDFGDGSNQANATTAAFTKTYAALGSYPLTLQVTTDSGCVSQVSTRTVTINPLPVVDFTLPGVVCLPNGNSQFTDKSTISDGSEAGFSYLWDFNDPVSSAPSTLKSPTHRYSTTGPFNVKLTVTAASGCSSSSTKLLNNILPQPKADFTINQAQACLGADFTFNDLSTGNTSSIASWNWSLGDGTTAITQNTNRTYTTPGTYNVRLFITNQDGCTSDTMVRQVTVHPYPTVNAGPDLVVLEGGSVTINPIVTGNDLLYKWTPSTYLNSDTARRPVSSPITNTTYRLTVTSRGGCTASDDVNVRLQLALVIPNVFSPNGDGTNDRWVIPYLDTYPDAVIEIFNRAGQILYKTVGYNTPWNGTYNGNPLPVGVYYYIINPKNGKKPLTGSVTILR